MSYETPSAADLVARYPEFDPVSEARIGAFITEALQGVSTSWVEADYQPAILALAAHMMAVEGEPARSNNPSAAVNPLTLGRAVQSRKVGDVSTTYGGGTAAGGAFSASAGPDYSATTYGRRYMEMLHRNGTTLTAI